MKTHEVDPNSVSIGPRTIVRRALTAMAVSVALSIAADQEAVAAHPTTVGGAKVRLVNLLNTDKGVAVDVNHDVIKTTTADRAAGLVACSYERPAAMVVDPKGPGPARKQLFGFVPDTAGFKAVYLGAADQARRVADPQAGKITYDNKLGGTENTPKLRLRSSLADQSVVTSGTFVGGWGFQPEVPVGKRSCLNEPPAAIYLNEPPAEVY